MLDAGRCRRARAEGNEAFRQQTERRRRISAPRRPLRAGRSTGAEGSGATLRAISDGGADAFYHGAIAAAVVAASQANGGLLTTEDFAATRYGIRAHQLRYRGYTVISAPPPSSGGVTLCEMLRVLEGYPLQVASAFTRASRCTHDRSDALTPIATATPSSAIPHSSTIRSSDCCPTPRAANPRARFGPHRATPSTALGGRGR